MIKIKQNGITLVELVIAIAIIGILAAVAIPSYQESNAKARRADAQGALLGFVSAMERFYTQSNSYSGAATAGADDGAPAATVYPSQVPLDGDAKFYNLTINYDPDNDGSDVYILSATPIVGGAMASDRCGTFTISSTGLRGAGDTNCWK